MDELFSRLLQRPAKVSFEKDPSISIKAFGFANVQGSAANQLAQVPVFKACIGSARIVGNAAADTYSLGAGLNLWRVEEVQEKSGVRVGGGLHASAEMSDVTWVLVGLRHPGKATVLNLASTLDAQACLKLTEGPKLRGKVSYSCPIAKMRLTDDKPQLVFGAWKLRLKAQLEGQGGSAVGVQMSRSVAPAGNLLGMVFPPRPQQTTEVYAKWRLVGKEGPVLRVGCQPGTGLVRVLAGVAF